MCHLRTRTVRPSFPFPRLQPLAPVCTSSVSGPDNEDRDALQMTLVQQPEVTSIQ